MSHSLRVDVPVQEVTLTEDRGMVARQGVIDWPGGPGVVVLAGVAPVMVDSSLQVNTDSGAIGRVTVKRSWEGVDVSELAAAARDRKKDTDRLADVTNLKKQHRDRANAMMVAFSKSISQAASAGLGDTDQWSAGLDALHTRLMQRADDQSAAQSAHEEARKELEKISAAIQATSDEWRLTARIEVALDAPAGPLTLTLRYLVPSAMWRPAYRAELSGDRVALSVQASLWQRTGEDWTDVPIVLSTARPSTGATLPPLYTDTLQLRDKTAQERRVIQAHSFDQSIQKASLTEDDGLPGVDDGGETRSLTTARPISVPSTGRPHRALIATAHATATVRYRCIPELMTLVFREVELENPLPHPLLAGPVTLITDGGTCGIGEIPFIAPGERFPLSFGSEDDVVVQYDRSAEIEERFALADHRWLSQRTSLINTGTAPLSVEVLMRVPVSELEQVQIILDRKNRSDPNMDGPDKQGFVRWQVDLPPNETVTRRVTFRVEKASNVQLPDFW